MPIQAQREPTLFLVAHERETLLFVVMLVGMGVAGSGAFNTIALVP